MTPKERRFLKSLLKTVEELLRIPSNIISKFTRSIEADEKPLIGKARPASGNTENQDSVVTEVDEVKGLDKDFEELGAEIVELKRDLYDGK